MKKPPLIKWFSLFALIAVIAGALISLELTIMASPDNSLWILAVYAGWVLAPFIMLWGVQFANKAWTQRNRAIWYILSVILPVCTVLIYNGKIVPSGFKPFFGFFLTPLFSLLIAGVAILLLRRKVI